MVQINNPTTGSIASCLTELATSIPRWKAVSSEKSKANEQALEDMLIGPFEGILDQLNSTFQDLGNMGVEVKSFFNQDFKGMMQSLLGMYQDDPTRLGGFMSNIESTFGQFRELGTEQANEILVAVDALKKAMMFHKPESILGMVVYAISNGFTSILLHEELLDLIDTSIAEVEDIVRVGGIPDKIEPGNPFKETLEHLCLARNSLSRVVNSLNKKDKFEKAGCSSAVDHLNNARQTLESGQNSPKYVQEALKSAYTQGVNVVADLANKTWLPNYKLKMQQEAMLFLMGPLGKTSNEIWNLHQNLSQSVENFSLNVDLNQYFVLIFNYLIKEIDRIEAMIRKSLGDIGAEVSALEQQIRQKQHFLAQVNANAGISAQNASIFQQLDRMSGYSGDAVTTLPANYDAALSQLKAAGINVDTSYQNLTPEQRTQVNRILAQAQTSTDSTGSARAKKNSYMSSAERVLQLQREIEQLREKQELSRQKARQFNVDGQELSHVFSTLNTHVEAFIQIAILQAMTQAMCRGYDLFNGFLNGFGKFNPNKLIGKLNGVLSELDPSECPRFYGNTLLCNMSKFYVTFNRRMVGKATDAEVLRLSRTIKSNIVSQKKYLSCLKRKLRIADNEASSLLSAEVIGLQMVQLVSSGFTTEKIFAMLGLDYGAMFGGRDISLYEALLNSLACLIGQCDNPGIQGYARQLMEDLERDRSRERDSYFNPSHCAYEAKAYNSYQGNSQFKISAITRMIEQVQQFEFCLPNDPNNPNVDTQFGSQRNRRDITQLGCRPEGQAYIPSERDNVSLVQNQEIAKQVIKGSSGDRSVSV